MKEEREDVIKELEFLEKNKDEELARIDVALKKRYGRLREMGSKRISNRLLRSLLRMGDGLLRSGIVKLRENREKIKREKRRIRYALVKLKKGKSKAAEKILEERRAEMLAIQYAFDNRFLGRL